MGLSVVMLLHLFRFKSYATLHFAILANVRAAMAEALQPSGGISELCFVDFVLHWALLSQEGPETRLKIHCRLWRRAGFWLEVLCSAYLPAWLM
jgi:hypothetical protein